MNKGSLAISAIFYNIPDRAIVVLLRFFKYIFQLVGSMFQVNIEISIPLSLQKCYALLGLRKTPFTEYLSCPSCHLLFNSDALLATNIRPELITCPFVEFPNHPQQRFRLPCNATLFIKVQKRGEIKFKPRRVYYYYGLKSAFCVLLNRPEFLLKCNLWSESRNSRGNLADITDGRIWQDMIKDMSSPINFLGILINIDFFQPFKLVSYSVGVIYAVIINLPRHIRYKQENVIIIGVIPGPHEPKKHLNSYLGPVVAELQELYTGQWFDTSTSRQFIKCVLVGLSSYIPASRKAAGYLGHMARKGCSRCLKEFPKVGDSTNYLGF